MPATIEVERIRRKDGSLTRTDGLLVRQGEPHFSAEWIKNEEFPVSDKEYQRKLLNLEKPLTEEEETERFGAPKDWKIVKEKVITRYSLLDVYKAILPLQALMFIHR